jgi:hypothetical protein
MERIAVKALATRGPPCVLYRIFFKHQMLHINYLRDFAAVPGVSEFDWPTAWRRADLALMTLVCSRSSNQAAAIHSPAFRELDQHIIGFANHQLGWLCLSVCLSGLPECVSSLWQAPALLNRARVLVLHAVLCGLAVKVWQHVLEAWQQAAPLVYQRGMSHATHDQVSPGRHMYV